MAKLVKLTFFLLLGLLGLSIATSPKLIFTLEVWPSAPTLSASAAYLLWVAIGAGVAARANFLVEIASGEQNARLLRQAVHAAWPLGRARPG